MTFTAVSAAWWNAKLPPDKMGETSNKTRDDCELNKVTQITHDVIMAAYVLIRLRTIYGRYGGLTFTL